MSLLKDLASWLGGAGWPVQTSAILGFGIGDLDSWREIGAFPYSAAGISVTPETAARVSSVFACARLRAGAVGSLPLPVYRRTPDGRERASDHPVDYLLNEEPTALCTAAVFWEYIELSKMFRGDGFALIVRNGIGDVMEFIPIDERCVRQVLKDGRWRYYVELYGKHYGVDQHDILQFPGFGYDLRTGRSMSVIQYAARQSIGTAIAADEFAARFFSSGASPKFVLKYAGKLNKEQIDELKRDWLEKVAGTQNAHLPFVLGGGADLAQVSLSAEDAQLLETRKFNVVDICRAFGVPPIMVGDSEKTSAWGTGIEQLGIFFVIYSLQPDLTKNSQEINRKVFPTQRFFCEYNVNALMRGDSKARGEFYRQALGGSNGPGFMTQNEVRKLENLPPMPEGGKLYIPAPGSLKDAKSNTGDNSGGIGAGDDGGDQATARSLAARPAAP